MSAASGLVAFIGTYGGADPTAGGITVLAIERDDNGAVRLALASSVDAPGEAGYLVYAAGTRTLYAVDERKTDGRGPVGPRAGVHVFSVAASGALTERGSVASPGPFPTYLALDEEKRILLTANHGSFEHVEHVVQHPDGTWDVEYLYDDSTVVLYRLRADGGLDGIADVQVLDGHGTDPNFSGQAGGHGQASPHAHSVVIDPSGQWVLVPDKGTDRILVYRLGDRLEFSGAFDAGSETGPRHLVFDASSGRAYVTYEFSSVLASFDFDQETGELRLIDTCSTVDGSAGRSNEPADVRLHPGGRTVYVNNRGEDSVAWFDVDDAGRLRRAGDVRLATSIHPGLAARSVALDPAGSLLLVTDRPADLVRAYDVDPASGALTALLEVSVKEPAFVTIADLSGAQS